MANGFINETELIDQLEEQIAEPVDSVSLFTDTEFPPRWNIYASREFESTFLKNRDRYKMVLYSLKRYENYLCSTRYAIYDSKIKRFIIFGSCLDEG